MPMGSIFVPTPETASLRYFLDLTVEGRKPIMFVGGAGTYKWQAGMNEIMAICWAAGSPAGSVAVSLSRSFLLFQRFVCCADQVLARHSS